MSESELRYYTKQVEALLEDADHSAANDDLRRALYNTTAAVTVMVGLLKTLAKAVVVLP